MPSLCQNRLETLKVRQFEQSEKRTAQHPSIPDSLHGRKLEMLNPKSFQTVQSLAQTYPGLSTQAQGYVEQAINPNRRGRVRYQATYWFGIRADARSLPPGTEVIVLSRQGNTLLVQPIVS